MSDKRASLEVIAPSVEEAIAKGLNDLGLTEEAVEVEVLDAGSRGLFGLGSRQARIRLKIKNAASTPSPRPAASASRPAQEQARLEAEEAVREDEYGEEDLGEESFEEEEFEEEHYAARRPASAPVKETTPEDEEVLRVAHDTVVELLEKMKLHANVSAVMGEAEDAHSKSPVRVNVTGKDLSILIGPRAETLNALQYIAGLIIGKELGRSIPLVVDVEGYRVRREQQIRQLARRMADQAIKTNRRQILEPMPANERRLVHIELRDNPNVTTQSIGEEPRRKVTIIPEK